MMNNTSFAFEQAEARLLTPPERDPYAWNDEDENPFDEYCHEDKLDY